MDRTIYLHCASALRLAGECTQTIIRALDPERSARFADTDLESAEQHLHRALASVRAARALLRDKVS